MRSEILALSDRVRAVGESFDLSLAANLLEHFEELASAHFESLLQTFRVQESDQTTAGPSCPKAWFDRLREMDDALGPDTLPDRPYTRLFWQACYFDPFRIYAPETHSDLRVFGRRLRAENEMDHILRRYFGRLAQWEVWSSHSTDPLYNEGWIAGPDGQDVFLPDAWITDGDGNLIDDPDWEVVDKSQECFNLTIRMIVSETIKIAERQSSTACSWQLAQFLYSVGHGSDLLELFVNDLLTNGELFPLGIRARLFSFVASAGEALPESTVQHMLSGDRLAELAQESNASIRQALAKFVILYRSLRKSLRNLERWAGFLKTAGLDGPNLAQVVPYPIQEEIRVAIIHSLSLRHLWATWASAFDDQIDSNRMQEFDNSMATLFELYLTLSTAESDSRLRSAVAVHPLLQNGYNTEAIAYMQEVLPRIESVKQFRSLLAAPESFADGRPGESSKVTPAEAAELGLQEGETIKEAYIRKYNEWEELKSGSDAKDELLRAMENRLGTITDLVQRQMKNDVEEAFSRVTEFEQQWWEESTPCIAPAATPPKKISLRISSLASTRHTRCARREVQLMAILERARSIFRT